MIDKLPTEIIQHLMLYIPWYSILLKMLCIDKHFNTIIKQPEYYNKLINKIMYRTKIFLNLKVNSESLDCYTDTELYYLDKSTRNILKNMSMYHNIFDDIDIYL